MKNTPLKLAKDTMPDLTGIVGKAWRHDLEAAVVRMGLEDRPPAELTVSSWVVYAPCAHPLWAYYWIGCVSLRSIPNAAPPLILIPNATHEVMVYALNPDIDPAIDDGPQMLLPANFHGQFIEACDEDAAARVQASVKEVVAGLLSPDTDFQREWVRRYSDSNMRLQESVTSWAGR